MSFYTANSSFFIQPIYFLLYSQFLWFHTIKLACLSMLYSEFSSELTLQNFWQAEVAAEWALISKEILKSQSLGTHFTIEKHCGADFWEFLPGRGGIRWALFSKGILKSQLGTLFTIGKHCGADFWECLSGRGGVRWAVQLVAQPASAHRRPWVVFLSACCIASLCVAVCCSVLQCVAVCCSVLQCVAMYHSVM